MMNNSSFFYVFCCLCACFVVMNCFGFIGYAEEISVRNLSHRDSITSLQIGDVIPEALWELPLEMVAPGQTQMSELVRLGNYRGKLIILDFWATWCTACIQNFPKMDSLQRRFNNHVVILPITRESVDKVEPFLSRYKRTNPTFSLPIFINGNALQQVFRHRTIPHYVWIDKDGVVAAVTMGDQLTVDNIDAVLHGKPAKIANKFERLDFDHNQPLLTNGNGGADTNFLYRSLLSGYMEGVNTVISRISDNGKKLVTRLYGVNCSVERLLSIAYPQLSGPSKVPVLLEMVHPERIRPELSADTGWVKKHTYCYDLIVPPMTVCEVKAKVASELEDLFQIRCEFVTKEVPSFILRRIPGRTIVSSRGAVPEQNLFQQDGLEKRMRNLPLGILVEALSRRWNTPLIDETGFDDPIDLDLPSSLADMEQVTQVLRSQGLDIVKESRLVDVFIIADRRDL